MTSAADDGPPEARWCTGVAAALAAASERVSRLAIAISDDWRDVHGQEWAERATLLHRELGRAAAEAVEIGSAIAQRATQDTAARDTAAQDTASQDTSPPVPPRVAVFGTAARDRGPRLGAVAGERTDTDLGMRLAQVPEPG